MNMVKFAVAYKHEVSSFVSCTSTGLPKTREAFQISFSLLTQPVED